jgi:hypothetical protein
MLNDQLVERLKPSAMRVVHAECGTGAYGLFAQTEGRYVIGLESSGKKYELMKSHYNEAIRYESGNDFDFPYTGLDAALIEKQNNDEHALSLIRSIKPALNKGAQVLLQVPKIIAVTPGTDKYVAYKETWSEIGCTPCYASFSASEFIRQMRLLGFEPVNEELCASYMGYFNRCAFGRHSGNQTSYPGQLPSFKEWTAEFTYTG